MRRFRDRKAAGHSDKRRALIPQLMMRCLIEPSLLHYGLPGYVLVIISFCHLCVSCFCPRPDDHLAKPGLIQKTLFNRGNGLDDTRGNASLPLEDFTAALRKFTPKWVAPRRGQLISFPYLVPCVQPRLKVKVRFQSARPFTYRSWLGLIHKPVTVPWWGGLPLSLTE